jgi:hypothetical protein
LQARLRGLALVVEVPEGVPAVMADEGRIQQVH